MQKLSSQWQDHQLRSFAESAQLVEFGHGERLLTEGQECQVMLVVLSGALVTHEGNEDSVSVSRYPEGALIGGRYDKIVCKYIDAHGCLRT